MMLQYRLDTYDGAGAFWQTAAGGGLQIKADACAHRLRAKWVRSADLMHMNREQQQIMSVVLVFSLVLSFYFHISSRANIQMILSFDSFVVTANLMLREGREIVLWQ